MDQGIKLRFGKGTAKHLKAFLAPAHAGQPVVHECNPEPGQLRGNSSSGFESPLRRRSPAGRRAGFAVSRTEPTAPMPRMRASMPASSVSWIAATDDSRDESVIAGREHTQVCPNQART